MKDRMTLGFDCDAAESAALTMADDYAIERIFNAVDWELAEKCRKRQIDNAIRRLASKDRSFARSVLKGKRWEELGISKQAFSCKLKKVCDLLETPVNRGRKRLSSMRGECVFG